MPGTIPPPPGFGGGTGGDLAVLGSDDFGGKVSVPGPVNPNEPVGISNFNIERIGSVIMAGERWKEDQSNGMLSLAAAAPRSLAPANRSRRCRAAAV